MRLELFLTILRTALFALVVAIPFHADVSSLTFVTDEAGNYLIIGLGPVNDDPSATPSTVGIGNASGNSNFELGAMRAPVPSTDSFLRAKLNGGDPGSGGPTLLGAVPLPPSNAAPVHQGVSYTGNIAITHPDGIIDLSNIGLFADPEIGIELSNGNDRDDAVQGSNSFFNDLVAVTQADGSVELVPGFPNTFFMNEQGELVPNLEEGITVKADSDSDGDTLNANQDARIDFNGPGDPGPGVTYSDDGFAALLAELDTAASEIGAAEAAATLDLTGLTGTIGTLDGGFSGNTSNLASAVTTGPLTASVSGETLTLTLTQPGITVVDILTGGNAFVLNNMNLVIDSDDPTAKVIFRLPGSTGHAETGDYDPQIMDITDANVLAGNTIGGGSIMFYTDAQVKDSFFDFDNTILNRISFWDLGFSGGGIDIDNAQGCVQLVADMVLLSDVRFERCAFDAGPPPDNGGTNVVPEPSSLALLGIGIVCMGFVGVQRRRKNKAA